MKGSLGIGHNSNQNVLSKIPNIPLIQTISCVNASCYLIDFEGNLWTFGQNDFGQLGLDIKTSVNTPKIISTLKDIQQISYGCSGHHFIAKNSQNHIFVTGNNYYGQLGTGNTESFNSQRNKLTIFHHLGRRISHSIKKCQKINSLDFVLLQYYFMLKIKWMYLFYLGSCKLKMEDKSSVLSLSTVPVFSSICVYYRLFIKKM